MKTELETLQSWLDGSDDIVFSEEPEYPRKWCN